MEDSITIEYGIDVSISLQGIMIILSPTNTLPVVGAYEYGDNYSCVMGSFYDGVHSSRRLSKI